MTSGSVGLPKLVGVAAVAALLDVDARIGLAQVEEALKQCGCLPVGVDVHGSPVWMDCAVVAVGDAVRLACLGKMIDVALFSAVMKEVLGDSGGPAVERAMARHLGTALDDVDTQLGKVLEQGQGLFRQQGENGQRLRELLQVCGALAGELRESNTTVKRDVGATLAKFEKQTEVLMQSVAEELGALRRSINELARVTK